MTPRVAARNEPVAKTPARSWLLATSVILAASSATGESTERAVGHVRSKDGIRIVYETSGRGSPALLFVHGWSCDRGYWRGQLPHFAAHSMVVALDLAGHGESGSGRSAWTMQAFGDDVAAVADALRLERVVLVGHSMGGDVVVEAARRLPGRVAGLVWVDAYTKLGSPRSEEQLRSLMAPFRSDFPATTRGFVRGMFRAGADPTLVERVAQDMSEAPPEVAIGALASALAYDRDVTEALRDLKLPVVAINADYRPTDATALQRHGVRAIVMADTGHFLMMEDPARFNALLAEIVDELAGRRSR